MCGDSTGLGGSQKYLGVLEITRIGRGEGKDLVLVQKEQDAGGAAAAGEPVVDSPAGVRPHRQRLVPLEQGRAINDQTGEE